MLSAPAAAALLRRPAIAALMAVEMVSLGALTIPLLVALPLAVRELDTGLSDESALSVVAAPGALSAMIAAPILGTLSDWTRSRGWGRAAWILGGAITGLLALVWVTRATSLPELTVAWCTAQFAYNATFVALYGLMGDHTDESNRAQVSGLFGASAVLAVVVSMGVATVVPKRVPVLVLPMGMAALVVAVVAVALLKDYAHRPVVAVPNLARGSLRGHGQFWLIWIQRLLAQLAYGLVAAYGVFFLMRRVGLAADSAATWVAGTAAVAGLVSAVTSYVTGRWARGRSYLPVIVVAMIALGVGSLIKAFGDSVGHYVAATIVVAAAIGCYYAVDLALVLRVVPPTRSGQFLGVFNIARTLPQSLAPAIAPMALAWGDDPVGGGAQNYLALYVLGAGAALIALTTLPWTWAARRPGESAGESADAGGRRSQNG